jgi:hypothetical protein
MSDKEDRIKLNNQEVTSTELREALNSLQPNQRIVETQKNNFFIIERMKG